ncbi:MAG: biotin--[acetyl-CoA-carboxylase] ligase [Gemmatimonas sp.]|jgi:BirA family biotin operon repressor/biotin-[acetyl-CoA-carboxylase] ligase|uniref:biotin--[acetyl-CoA-carboxylase] ligase n=1 Tax=Gemmatimonas sp. TaxID=1962908 RepID=UPI00391F4DEF|nr:biotin--[acetyl-CoA-carboxylase] ligase [Gemmatimonadota bacterium]
MALSNAGAAGRFVDGAQPALAARLGLAHVEYRTRTTSTMDVAHALADHGAPAGTLILAGVQEAGRGRGGKAWASEADAGLWCTLIERPADPRALDVLALRVGLGLASAVAPFVDGPVHLKWPNDLVAGGGKLAGILIEVRWRDGQPEWVAIGVGINLRAPAGFPMAAHVRAGVTRDALLVEVVPVLRAAAACGGPLSDAECAAWDARDAWRAQRVLGPVAGVVQGIAPNGAVLIRDDDDVVHAVRSGSLQPAGSD